MPLPSCTSGLVRGLRKFAVPVDRPRLRSAQVKELVRLAVDRGHVHLARLFAVARQFLLRVADEGFPLQLDGKAAVAAESLEWHSRIILEPGRATLVLRTRKNEPRGASLARSCICLSQSPLLCGVCALHAQADESRRNGISVAARLFRPLESVSALIVLRRLCQHLGLESPGWHAFRRGMAQDLFDGGATLSQLLRAGGWKSSAFLRYLLRRDVDFKEASEFILEHSDSDAH